MRNFEVKTSNGIGKIKDIYISDLGFILVKVCFDNKICINYTIGELGDILNDSIISLV